MMARFFGAHPRHTRPLAVASSAGLVARGTARAEGRRGLALLREVNRQDAEVAKFRKDVVNVLAWRSWQLLAPAR
jgi:hypothetical protein